jgi:Lysozyme like domain
MIMTPLAIFETMRAVGFPPTVAVTMTAIALRESRGDPAAFNPNTTTGDRSYGLLQINMANAEVEKLIQQKVLLGSAEEGLLDPLTNAKAGFALWAGNNANLNMAWYLDRAGVYKLRYEAHLPEAQAAALESKLGT